ncbi:MAG: hypothetical protein U9P36_14605 [Thermodesulfobacteriota bacterium]|nr:hypothetical protein [Thermodesulfobacteriota bacterium]
MKKVLVAGAALLIAGSMVSAAYAEVNLSGDARARYVGKADYKAKFTANPNGTFSENTNGYDDSFNSRIRVKFDAKANGGAFMKARLRFDDFTWDGQGWGAHTETKNVWADYAYIGVPTGAVTWSAGRMPADFSKWFSYDGRPTRVKADWKSAGGFRLIGLIDVIDESSNSLDDWDDNDFMGYGLVAATKFGDWGVKAYARYHDDGRAYDSITESVPLQTSLDPAFGQREFQTQPTLNTEFIRPGHRDRSGFLGAISTSGKIANFGIDADIAYKEADVQGTADDGWGWTIDGSMDLGPFSPHLVIGGTYDGYLADDDFGFIMVGAAEPITKIARVGNIGGDSHFIGLVGRYALSDQFKFAGNLVYYDYDVDAADRIADALEISGSATYVISEGADFTYKLGWLSPSYDGRLNALGVTDDGVFGHYLRLAIKF